MGIAHPCLKLLRRLPIVGILAAGAVLGGCTTHPVPPISAQGLASARAFKEFTVYWAGPKVNGAPLTGAVSPRYFYAPVGFTAYYGTCEGRGILRDQGCTLPLKITTSVYSPHSDAPFGPQRWLTLHGVPAVVYHGGKDIEIYTDRMDIDIAADSPARALAAARALEPFNRTPTPGFPAFPQPYYTPNLSQAEINAQAGATGTTGVTGATSDIAPPAALEPAPSSNSNPSPLG
jgi:hypothetical protein